MPVARKLQIAGQPVFKQQVSKSRRERTLALGPSRLAAAQKSIRLLRQLANPQAHELRGDEPKKIVSTLQEELNELAYELENPGKSAGPAGVFQRE